jgi:hypothetical protein
MEGGTAQWVQVPHRVPQASQSRGAAFSDVWAWLGFETRAWAWLERALA